jgi:predicted MPP superfamily phosphohydrolase
MISYRIIQFSIVLILLQYLVYYSFVKYLKSKKFYKPGIKYYAAIPFLLFNMPFIIASILTGGNFDFPRWIKTLLMGPFYIWQGATLFIALWLLAGKIIKLPFKIPLWIMKIFKPLRQKIENLKNKKPVQTVDLGRRKFIRYSTMALSAYAFSASTYGIIRHNSYEINYKGIKIDNLPDEFKGFTITLFSDIHAGQYMDEHDMKEYSDLVNSLNSDMICIPGDFVNFDHMDSHHVANAFRDLKAKFGVFGSLGNHDFFQNADYVANVMNNESPVKMLRNSSIKIEIGGKELYLLGLDDTRHSGSTLNEIILTWLDELNENLAQTNVNYKSSAKILLCHKPYGFDDIVKRGIDLTLAGHTHGGQVVPVKLGKFNLSFAAFVSPYIEGHYKIEKSNMYVSRGIGTVAIPIRINCPPEITKITLM